jgi:hypothetical protein
MATRNSAFQLMVWATFAVSGLGACGTTDSASGGPLVVADTEADVSVDDAGTDAATADAATTDAADAIGTDAVAAEVGEDATADAASEDAAADAQPDVAPVDALPDDVLPPADATVAVDAVADADVAPDVALLCTNATSCDDDDACTTDTCEVTGCVHAAILNCQPAAKPCDATTPCQTGVCDLIASACVPCIVNLDCIAGNICSGHTCVATVSCATDIACKATKQVCEKQAGICVDCLTAVDCATGHACVSNLCVTSLPCKSSKDCGAICDQANGVCVDCLEDVDCGASQFCSPAHTCLGKICSGPACGIGGTLFACNANGSGFAAASSCDDANPCTNDGCKSSVGCTHLPASATCTDGDACTGADVCVDGNCAAGAVVSCDDSNPCNIDTCDAIAGCQHAPGSDGVACSDASTCTTGDVCAGGACAGTAIKCDDGNACTDDSCDAVKGCVFSSNASACDDGNPCTSNDACTASTCGAGPATVCDDGNSCTDNSCVIATGCVFLANAGTCTDNSACTSGDACKDGKCASGPGCSDGDLCTVDSCDPAVGCSFAKSACDDSDPCTTDACDAGTGKCAHTYLDSCCTTGKVFYSRNFDDGSTSSFVVNNSSNSATKGWQVAVNAKQAYSPKNALWYGDAAQGTYDIKNSYGQVVTNSGTAAIGPIAMPATLPPGATLQFTAWLYLDVETCTTFDKLTISATNGAKTVQLWSKSDLPDANQVTGNCATHIVLPTGWTQLVLPLPFAAGDFVTLKFAFDTVDAEYNDGQGVFIDDVQIQQKCK